MKRMAVVASIVVVAAMLGVVTSGQGKRRGQQDVYFGYLLGSTRLAGVALDFAAPDRAGRRALRAFVCDGLGPPEGISVWFTGDVPADAAAGNFPLRIRSVGGQEELVITLMKDGRVLGVFTEASGNTAQFAAYPTIDGAGIYQVSLDQNLRYTGTSTDGAQLDAQADGEGTTTGTIKPANGKEISFTVHSLALASPANLAAYGLPEDYLRYRDFNQVPGSYVAVIAPGGSHWFGRDGLVRLGLAGFNIIGLDKKVR